MFILFFNTYAGKLGQNDAKILKNDWNPGTLVLIYEYLARTFQWISTWQGLDVFSKIFASLGLGEN